MKKILIAGLCLIAGQVWATTGTVSVVHYQMGTVERTEFSWTSGTGSTNATATIPMSGELLQVEFVPVTPMPTSAYSVTLATASGNDIFGGLATSLSTNTASLVAYGINCVSATTTNVIRPVVDGLVTLTTGSTGNSKSGKVIIYHRPGK